MAPSIFLRIRKFDKGRDDTAVKRLESTADRESVNRRYLALLLTETTVQVLVAVSAVLFILCGLPLYACWISFPLGAVLLYMATHLAARLAHLFAPPQPGDDNHDLNGEKTGVWVAELLPDTAANATTTAATPATAASAANATTTAATAADGAAADAIYASRVSCSDSTLVRMDPKKMQNYLPQIGDSGCIVGVCRLRIKLDPSLREPPNSVGNITQFYVDSSFRRQRIGEELLSVVWSHALAHFRAVEVVLVEEQFIARNFFEKHDWNITSHTTTTSWGGVSGLLVGVASLLGGFLPSNRREFCLRKACIGAPGGEEEEDDMLQTVLH